jgi:hypothetical protein
VGEFAVGGGPPLRTRVQRWLPPPRTGAAGDDIAGLVLTSTSRMSGPAEAAHRCTEGTLRSRRSTACRSRASGTTQTGGILYGAGITEFAYDRRAS